MTTAKQYACVFSQELADRLNEVQASNPQQFRVSPLALTDGRYMIRGAILSEVPNGLYAEGFAMLDPGRFDEIALIPFADALALRRSQIRFRRLIVSGQSNIGTAVQI
jgi:hypothetical protein